MTVSTKIAEVIPHVKRVISHRLVPMLHGAPAIGKSDIIRKIAKDGNLKVIDVRLSTYDPADMNGLPNFGTNGKRTIAEYVGFDVFPVEGDDLPLDAEGKPMNGWILFLDELPSAAPAVQAAAFKVILDRYVGQQKLHDRVFIVAAGNTEDDGAIVNPIPTPLQSRMVNFLVVTDLKSFMKWALPNGLDYRIAAFLEFKPEYVHHFKPDHDDLTFAAPRTWMFVNSLIKGKPVTRDNDLALIAGCVSQGVATEFISFVKLFEDTPKISDIIANPMTAKCPEDNPSLLYATGGSLAQHATKENLPAFIQYIERMPTEFMVVTLRQILGRHEDLANETCLDDWISKYSSELWN